MCKQCPLMFRSFILARRTLEVVKIPDKFGGDSAFDLALDRIFAFLRSYD